MGNGISLYCVDFERVLEFDFIPQQGVKDFSDFLFDGAHIR
jgi:hypothetical protein